MQYLYMKYAAIVWVSDFCEVASRIQLYFCSPGHIHIQDTRLNCLYDFYRHYTRNMLQNVHCLRHI